MLNRLLLTSALALSALQLSAINPYLPLWEFIPDGEPYVFEDPDQPGQYRVYVYGSHDMLRDKYCGLDQVVWSASVNDLNHWRYDGVIFESKVAGNGKDLTSGPDILYAPDIAVKRDANGKPTYYLYPNNQAEGRKDMIARSDRPNGPFHVTNWDMKDPEKTEGILYFDPAVFVDDDGRVYGYWGFKQSFGAELDPTTMCTVKPGTKVVEDMITNLNQEGIFRFFEASSIRKIKDKYVFIYSRWSLPGEWGLRGTNYTLAYCYSNNPLGPFTYGGTIIDCRGRETRPDGTTAVTATFTGNTHGSICEINGQWWVFYHRQTGTNEFSRQAMVAPITVDVKEGPDGYVKISEAEYTCEGFETNGLDPLKRYAAGIACYYTHPDSAYQEYPNMIYAGSHPQPVYETPNGDIDPYDPSINHCPMVNNTAGSIVGYKYFNLDSLQNVEHLNVMLNYTPEGNAGTITCWLDRPNAEEGGTCLGTVNVAADSTGTAIESLIPIDETLTADKRSGKHALFLVFASETQHKSICQLNEIGFVVKEEKGGNAGKWVAIACAILAAITAIFAKKKKK